MRRLPELPPEAAAKVEEIERLKVLGATRQLTMMADALVGLAEGYDGPPAGLAAAVSGLADHFVSTRGQSSQAVSNAVHLMVDGVEAQVALSVPALRRWIVEKVRAYESASEGWMQALIGHGTELLAGAGRILAYDYSSSVAEILRVASDRRSETGLGITVVVPESRSLDGGHKYVKDLRDTDLAFEFVPDSSIASALSSCEAVLEGAETLSAEGGCYNTVGTFSAALAARHYGVPFYVVSTLIKTDLETPDGEREIPELELGDTLLAGWEPHLARRVRAACPDLDYTPPGFITALVTEVGRIPPEALRGHAARLLGAEEKHG